MEMNSEHPMRPVGPLPDVAEIAATLGEDAPLAMLVDPITRKLIGGGHPVPQSYAEAVRATFDRIAAHHRAEAEAARERDARLIRHLQSDKCTLEMALGNTGGVGQRLATLAGLMSQVLVDEAMKPGELLDLAVDCMKTMAAQIATAHDALDHLNDTVSR